MATHAPAARLAARTGFGRTAQRAAFVALLVAAPLLPHVSSDRFDFPAVTSFWALPVFGALMLLPFIGAGAHRRHLYLDLLAMVSFLVALGFERPSRAWPVLLIYPPLLYLGARMIWMARSSRHDRPHGAATLPLAFPRSWLVIAIVVLTGVHVSWVIEGTTRSDVAHAGVQGASNILHGRPIYQVQATPGAFDPHTDTYGPVDYEAYLPFAAVTAGSTAAKFTTLFFDLLTALLLFALGRRLRGAAAGIVLAYCWLAFPFTLYEDALGFNDSIVAAALVGTLLVARSPARRGVLAAMAGWTKLSPLALVPLLAGCAPAGGRPTRRGLWAFAGGFGVATALIFAPVLAHGTIGTFVSRTFGFQAHRTPALSIWAVLQGNYSAHAAWIGAASRVIHGLLTALTGAFVILVVRMPRRQDLAGLAAVSAAVLIAMQVCLSYYSFSYILWFAPLVLVALLLGGWPGGSAEPATDVRSASVQPPAHARSAQLRAAKASSAARRRFASIRSI